MSFRGWVGALLLVSCVAAPDELEGVAASPIIGGTPDNGDPAVMLLAAWPGNESSLGLCTATQS